MTLVKCDNGSCPNNDQRGQCQAELLEVKFTEFGSVCQMVTTDEVEDQSGSEEIIRPVIKWYVDGSGKGQVACVNGPRTKVIEKYTRATTNNEAEWEAVLAALGYVSEFCSVEILTDSNDVVKWMKGEFRTREPRMTEYKKRVDFMIKQKKLLVTFTWVPREENLAGQFLEGKLKID